MPHQYVSEVADLSLLARLAVAMHLFTGYCNQRELAHREIDGFIEYLWRFFTVNGPGDLRAWEADRPPLIGTGLGCEYPSEFEEFLACRGVSVHEFRQILACTTEVLYGSMYAAADDAGSRQILGELSATVTPYGIEWPNLSIFASARWSERHGWGHGSEAVKNSAARQLYVLSRVYHDGMNPTPLHPPTDPGRSSAAVPKPRPRLRCADRSILVPAMALDDLLTPDHHARTVWQFVQGLNLTPLLDAIKAVEGHPGRSATDPRIFAALWLFATVEGIGSARALDYLCTHQHGFRWLCGGVSVNYHSLAAFRVAHPEFLNDVLTHGVASLMAEELVDLNRVAQDGMRVRASAGAASFRRRPTLEQCLEEAHTQVQRLRAELESDPAAANRRQQQAQERAASGRNGSARPWNGCRNWRPRRRRRTRPRPAPRPPTPKPRS